MNATHCSICNTPRSTTQTPVSKNYSTSPPVGDGSKLSSYSNKKRGRKQRRQMTDISHLVSFEYQKGDESNSNQSLMGENRTTTINISSNSSSIPTTNNINLDYVLSQEEEMYARDEDRAVALAIAQDMASLESIYEDYDLSYASQKHLESSEPHWMDSGVELKGSRRDFSLYHQQYLPLGSKDSSLQSKAKFKSGLTLDHRKRERRDKDLLTQKCNFIVDEFIRAEMYNVSFAKLQKHRYKSYSLWLLSDPFPNLPWENILRVIVRNYVGSQFRCPICLCEEFFMPIMTPCGHIFCGNCILHCLHEQSSKYIEFANDEMEAKAKEAMEVDFWQKVRGTCPLCNFDFHFQQSRLVDIHHVSKHRMGDLIDLVLLEREYGTEHLQTFGMDVTVYLDNNPSESGCNNNNNKDNNKNTSNSNNNNGNGKEEWLSNFRRFDIVNIEKERALIDNKIAHIEHYMQSLSPSDKFDKPYLMSLLNYLQQFQAYILQSHKDAHKYNTSTDIALDQAVERERNGTSHHEEEQNRNDRSGEMDQEKSHYNYVYQSLDGQYLLLDPLNWHMLRAHYMQKSLSKHSQRYNHNYDHQRYHSNNSIDYAIEPKLPRYLKHCKILQVEKFTFTPKLKAKFKWLVGILPYNADFGLVEIDLKDYVSTEVYEQYRHEIERRARHREQIRQEKIEEEKKLAQQEEELVKQTKLKYYKKPLDISLESFPPLSDISKTGSPKKIPTQPVKSKQQRSDKTWSDLLKHPRPKNISDSSKNLEKESNSIQQKKQSKLKQPKQDGQ